MNFAALLDHGPRLPAPPEEYQFISPGMKRCKRCGLVKPAEANFRLTSKCGKFYHRNTCRACEVVLDRMYRKKSNETDF